MVLTFYPHEDDTQKGTLNERIEILMEAAERYKALILDETTKVKSSVDTTKKWMIPRDQVAAYNWEEVARVLKEVRELPEIDKLDKSNKSQLLAKLAEVYEVLRAAKMPKLEAVRIALISESNQLRGQIS